MQRTALIAAGIVVVLLLVVGGLWLIVWRVPNEPPRQALSATPGDTVVTLNWPGAATDGYYVYRDGDPTPISSVPISGTIYEDIGLTNGRTYTYTVAPAPGTSAPGQPAMQISVAPRSK